MKLVKKSKRVASKAYACKKECAHLNEQEKKNRNKSLHTGNLIEKKWFPNGRK